jgi:hypothetical protein
MCRPLVDWLRMSITRRYSTRCFAWRLSHTRFNGFSAGQPPPCQTSGGSPCVSPRCLGEVVNENHLARYEDEGNVSRLVLRHPVRSGMQRHRRWCQVPNSDCLPRIRSDFAGLDSTIGEMRPLTRSRLMPPNLGIASVSPHNHRPRQPCMIVNQIHQRRPGR